MNKIYYIYGMFAPDDKQIRYIGRSVNPQKRVPQHSSSGTNHRKLEWIRSVKSRGLEIDYIILQTCENLQEAKDAENNWIALFLENRCELLNWIYPGYNNREMIQAATHQRNKNIQTARQYYDNL